MYILAGLIFPQKGTLYFNNQAIDEALLPAYRDQICCLFSDQYLFDTNYEDYDLTPANHTVSAYLRQLGLAGAVKFNVTNHILTQQLSAGQKKRLALVYAMIENKEIMIMDEFAAEQDHYFRKHFYEVFLPDMKQQGKTVILVTHDLDYLHCADRVVEVKEGTCFEYNLQV
jgi:ABC-type siderophore export system fused ATPase/permease subunit